MSNATVCQTCRCFGSYWVKVANAPVDAQVIARRGEGTPDEKVYVVCADCDGKGMVTR